MSKLLLGIGQIYCMVIVWIQWGAIVGLITIGCWFICHSHKLGKHAPILAHGSEIALFVGGILTGIFLYGPMWGIAMTVILALCFLSFLQEE